MKKFIILFSLILAEVLICIVYGLSPQNRSSTLVSFAVGAVIAFGVLLFCALKKHRISEIIVDVTVFSLIIGIIPFIFCTEVNQIDGKLVAEYTVTVERISGRGDGSVSFYTPDGNYGSADLNDHRIMILDDEEFVDVGDTVKIREYIGIFKKKYYVFVEEVYP
ncbi:MAG: hypothetical protein IJ457_03135 [Clostridia bacterium]|nr:hypothetical protein [Clostridia bacterium]